MFQSEQQYLETQIRQYCEAHQLPFLPLEWKPIPFKGEWGMSTSCFAIAAADLRATPRAGVSVPQHAQQIAEGVREFLLATTNQAADQAPAIQHIEAIRGYLNVYFSTAEYARRGVDAVLTQKRDFGRGTPRSERVMIEYAQPNTHHSFHIGHARNAILGEALARIVEFAGYETIRASYPGDIGLGVITVLWIYDKFYRGQEPQGIHERGQWLLKLYVEATALLEPKENESEAEKAQREAWEAERREMYRRWDAGDPHVRQLWQMTREWSLEELRDILRMLDIHIDVWFFESEVDEPAKAIVEELIARGIADDERPQGGAVVVKIDEKLGLKKETYRTNVILRSDGTTLYLTKDLALAKIKFEKYGVDRSVYVVDVRQSLHLQQAFAILRLMGYAQAEKCYHLGYGFVSLPEGAMSARRGRVVLFKEVADEAERRALAAMGERTSDLSLEERRRVARQIGLGALKYAMLAVDNNRDTVFDMDAALNFEGHTGPYIQNAHVRANSILRKAGLPCLPSGDYELPSATFDYELSVHEIQLVELLARFPAAVEQAVREYRPLVIANYAFDLANAFHSFYHATPVLQAEAENVRRARLRLVAAAKQVLANALYLLSIEAPEVM